ncbi:trigger factor [Patescibacteria group bacterium]|nr:trigger factor [Patescibacteria group bacterium]MBU1015929.1 trigger factor [Patescibacteria group bacterium]MBU1685098.1 trigger factor [Patescibacteria group bacterium]MBU1938192.1 trigger factor [Patescibacteria group bacterium]
MKAEIKQLPKSQVELTVTVPYADYIRAEKSALEKISKELKIDGFRSGHIPEEVVREKAGQTTIQSVTLEEIIPVSYASAVKEHNVQVIAQPKVEIKSHVQKEGDDFVYAAIVSVMPEVQLGNYKKIKVKRPKVKVTDKELNETLDMIVNRFAEWKNVERPAKTGDRVEVDFEGFDKDGKAISNTASKNHPVILGSKSMVPGFEEALVGVKTGDEKEFDIDFPKEYHAKEMQGKKVTFKVKVGRVEEKLTQELNEAMVEKATGQKQSVDDFKKRVAEDLEREIAQRAQADVDNKVVQEIIKITKAELPESLIEDEIGLLKEERKQAVTRQGLTWEQYLQHIKKTDEDFAKDHHKPAEERLLARLGVNQIIKAEKVEVSADEVEKRIQEIAAAYPEEQRKKVLEYYKKDSEAYRQLKNNLSADKLINMFVEE